MASDKGKRGGNEQDDAGLWRAYTHDIQPIKKPRKMAEKPKTPVKKPKASAMAPPSFPIPTHKNQSAELDGSTDKKLRSGKLSIEGRLDMHGMRQDEAHEALINFVTRAHKAQKRCVLVITGKGNSKGGEGVLRQKLPLWLSGYPISDMIIKSVQAAQKDGGSGAFYLYLRRVK